jgi:hypothetical protein
MFLVEPVSGQRRHYPSARALGYAIRRGELGPAARIFHEGSERWLPITVHPEYRKAEIEWEAANARALRGRRWTFLAGQGPDAEESRSPANTDPIEVPMLVPDESDSTWLGNAFRSLKHMVRPGV